MKSRSMVPSATSISVNLQSSGDISSSSSSPADEVDPLTHVFSQRQQHLHLSREREKGGCFWGLNSRLPLLFLFHVEAVLWFSPMVMVNRTSCFPGLNPLQNIVNGGSITTPIGKRCFLLWLEFLLSPTTSYYCEDDLSLVYWWLSVHWQFDITPIKPYISVKDCDILHDGQHSRSNFGEGNGYKIQKIFWRLGRQIWDPGITDLWRNLQNEKKMSAYFWYFEFDVKGSKIRGRGLGLSLDKKIFWSLYFDTISLVSNYKL